MPFGKDPDKTEPATPKKRSEMRMKGQVAQSKELPSAFVLLSALGVLSFCFSSMFVSLKLYMTTIFNNIGQITLDANNAEQVMMEAGEISLSVLMPLLIFIVIAGVLSNIMQIGFLFTTQVFVPKFSKLNPISGFKRLVSLKSLIEVFKSLLKIIIVSTVAYLIVKKEIYTLPALIGMDVMQIFAFIGEISFKIWLYSGLVIILLAILDYAFQRWEFENNMMMTKQEVKDESKQREGDPAVKARIRSIQKEMAQTRMMEAVPEADAIITNPTRLAIAIKYDAKEMVAPRVLAKGSGYIAEKIRKIAVEKDIPIVEDKPLARNLYKLVGVGEYVPVNLYRAVAEVLAYIYRLKGVHGKKL